jgi:RNA polymerase sigma-70 factor (ECF subfamily)
MSQTDDSFGQLLERARAGDESALGQLAKGYEAEVRTVARVLLGPALRPYLDSMDVMQSVHKSLLIGLRGNKYQFDGPKQLVALASTLVRRKVARHWRHLQKQQRMSLGGEEKGNLPEVLADLNAPLPPPDQAAEYSEALKRLHAHLDESERKVMELRLQGYSTADVARELGLDPDVLRVKLSRLRQRLRSTGVLSEWL